MNINRNHFVTLAALEGIVIASAILRTVVVGLDLGNPPTLIWFAATMVLAGASVTHFVLRNSMLGARVKAGENVEEDRKQIMSVSVAIVVAAAMLSAVGPRLFGELLGSP